MNRRYYLKERLDKTEKWIEHYLETEDHIQISRRAYIEACNKIPVLGWVIRIFYLPTDIIKFFNGIKWRKEYYKACKEVEIIRKELENYDN